MHLSFSARLRLLFVVQSLVSLLFIYFVGYNNALFPNRYERELKSSFAILNKQLFLNFAAERILHFDEVLTQSARNAVLTQQPEWEFRYLETEKALDKFINMGLSFQFPVDQKVQQLKHANNQLVGMEMQAFALAKLGNSEAGLHILNSGTYQKHKLKYAQAVSAYSLPKDDSFYRNFGQSYGQLNLYIAQIDSFWDNLRWSLVFFPILLLVVHFGIVLAFLRKFGVGVRNLNLGFKRMEEGEYHVQIPELSGNELGKLAAAFNRMTSQLHFLNHAIQEKRIQEELSKQRKTFRKELHDKLTILLASLKLHLELLKKDSENLNQFVETSESLLKEAYFQLREIAEGPGSNEIEKAGFLHSLKSLIQRIGLVYKISVRFDVQISEEDLAHMPLNELYAMVLEITGNALRHSKATEILLSIKKQRPYLYLTVSDNGTGFQNSVEDAMELGNGLRNMRERTQQLQGILEIKTLEAQGTNVTIKIPL